MTDCGYSLLLCFVMVLLVISDQLLVFLSWLWIAVQRDFLRENVLEGEEKGPGPSLAWLPLCDRYRTMLFRWLAKAAPESKGRGFFFILTEPLSLSGWVQLSEKFLTGRRPSESWKSLWGVCVLGGGGGWAHLFSWTGVYQSPCGVVLRLVGESVRGV